jgi:lipopolysaccharide biosynthesis glycosyltransferase
MTDLRVFIGWDSREEIAYEVARDSLLTHSTIDLEITPIKLPQLVENGIYTREIDPLATTEFTYSRFFVPYLAGYDGWALFCDCDFLFFSDIKGLLQYCDESKALFCVKHNYTPRETVKMDGQIQTVYPRKNWSSFMLFNCRHPSTKKLLPEVVNRETGAYLHRMVWSDDAEIGQLPTSWNWLEGWNKKPGSGYPNAVHFTRGGPWFDEYRDVDYAAEWNAEAEKIYSQGVLQRPRGTNGHS